MSREKQIEEMARDLQETSPECCEAWHCRGCPYEKYSEGDFCYGIQQAEKLHQKGYHKQEWISVNERVPTDEKQVLAYYDFAHGDGSFGMPFIGVLCYFAHDLNPHWQHESTGLRVTHWMPLPDAPKGE